MKDQRLEQVLWGFILPAITAALMTVALLAVLASSAEANYNGCRYDPDTIDPITYDFYSVELQINTSVRTGEAVWDSTSAPGYFSEDNYASDPEINIYDAYRSSAVE